MAKAVFFPDGTTTRMRELIQEAYYATDLKKIFCVLFGSLGMVSRDIAQLVGYNKTYVKRIWMRYRQNGESVFFGQKGAGNKNRALLSWEEEKAFLKPFFKEASQGGVLIVKNIHQTYEKQFQRSVYPSLIYDLLHRHGWRKITPRPSHPKTDQRSQEAFKTSFPPDDKTSKSGGRKQRTQFAGDVSR